MGKLLRWLSVFAAVTVLTALFEPLIVRGLEWAGWYDDPAASLEPALNWLAGIVGDAAFPWVAAGLLGGSVGVWLHWTATRLDAKRRREWLEEVYLLAGSLRSYNEDLRTFAGQKTDDSFFIPIELRQEYKSLSLRLKSLRLRAPNLDGLYGLNFVNVSVSFFEQLYPLLRNGHIRQARRDSRQSTKVFNLNKSNLIESQKSTLLKTRP